MNLVGKIFTVLIFLMCVVFGTFALMVHATHKNWKEVVIGLNNDLTKANKEKQDVTEQKAVLQTTLDNERKEIQKRLIALEQEKNLLDDDKKDLKTKLEAVEKDARALAMTIKGISQDLGVLQTAVTGMRDSIKLTVEERDRIQKALVNTTDDLMNAVNERQRLEKLGRELAGQKVKMEEALKYYKLSADGYQDNGPPPVEGEVTSVPRPDVVEISLGADDGVRKGHKFIVTRPSTGKYIGMIVVIQVDYPNRAVCRPDKEQQLDQIQKGDHVKAYTKFR
jgi:predicted  nucleic acid-binding Zn-ribbon protein